MEKKTKKRFDEKTKNEIVNQVLAGKTKTEVAKKYGVKSIMTISRWMAKQADQVGLSAPAVESSQGLGDIRVENAKKDIIAENYFLKTEVQKLKAALGETVYKNWETRNHFFN